MVCMLYKQGETEWSHARGRDRSGRLRSSVVVLYGVDMLHNEWRRDGALQAGETDVGAFSRQLCRPIDWYGVYVHLRPSTRGGRVGLRTCKRPERALSVASLTDGCFGMVCVL
jgi:hypothetical protein